MKKILVVLMISTMIFGLVGCGPTDKEFVGGKMTIIVPSDWKAIYSEVTNEIYIEDTGEEGTGASIEFQLIGSDISPEQAAILFEGVINTYEYTELDSVNVAGLDLRVVTFEYYGQIYDVYGGTSHNGQQLIITVIDKVDEDEINNIINSLILS